jgi:hypothetical protein
MGQQEGSIVSASSNNGNAMKWIEQIHVRSSSGALQEAMPGLVEQLVRVEETACGAETFLMQHALYDGDLAVVVVWRNESAPQKTREGLMVAMMLQQLGPVDHAVWIPATAAATTHSTEHTS